MKKLLLAALFAVATLPAKADEKDLTPAVMAEVAMAEQLLALGKARGEPMLILAAVRLRDTLGQGTAPMADSLSSRDDAIAAARDAAKGDPALLGVIADVEAEGSRRMCIYARNGVCY